jgi:hypothetical protein
MQIRPANRGRGDLDNHVCWLLDLWVGDPIHPDVVFSVPTKGSHNIFLFGFFMSASGNANSLRATVHFVAVGKHKEENLLTISAKRR